MGSSRGTSWRAAIGRRVRELRQKHGWTQQELAFHAKMAASFISGIEKGVRAASIDSLEKLAAGLRVTLPELVADDALRLGREVERLLDQVPPRSRAAVLRAVREVVALAVSMGKSADH